MNLDWRRLRAVVFESDDWGLCAWSPDEQAYRVLSDTPAFRSPAGRRYGGSTLESAADVQSLAGPLAEFKGGDGLAPVWQANTIVAAPDYQRLRAPQFDAETLPLVSFPDTPSRWRRPGAWDAVRDAIQSGLWWPELHGLHHLPETAWLTALRRGVSDARRAHEQQSPICLAVEASGEYDPSEPEALRTRNFENAVARFEALVGRKPTSFCPPDYRWDERLEADVERLAIPILQGKGEQFGMRFPKLHRWLQRGRWRHQTGSRYFMPPRIAFEPQRAEAGRVGAAIETAHRAVREAWSGGRPAAVSTHRANYAHLDLTRSAAGRAALRDLLQRLAGDGAMFLADVEVMQIQRRGWSLRHVADQGVVVRYYGVPGEPIRFPLRSGASGLAFREGRGGGDGARASVEGEQVVARLHVGEYRFDWTRA